MSEPQDLRPAGPNEPSAASDFDRVADLVARAILALECDGREAADAVLAREPELAELARARMAALRRAGMLREAEDALPERIGPYRVLERLGRGGMGEVWLAEQKEPLPRRVALKVIRRGMDTHEVLARFALERQALALLDHPNIAKVLDAGETPDQRPYLVMEYVAGVPITRYCDDRQLDTAERLALFAEVCETVQHAHERGILHRDLKPSNILVTDRDGRPWPKVIDFGVAKSLQQRLVPLSLHTQLGRVLGTPEYMSPEQAANRVDVDTRTDVYSLGVVLYELLTGQLPVDSSQLRDGVEGRMHEVLHEVDPPTPSTRVSTLGDAGTSIAQRRATDPGTLRRLLRGDLDWITMRALERDRNRRYPMAIALAADLRRHLAFEPVTAGPPGARYLLSRFAKRHRSAAIAAASVFVALVVGLAFSLGFWREARAAQLAEAGARSEAEEALDVALRAADALLVEVGGERLRRFPGLDAERRRLLESGLAFCRSVIGRTTAGVGNRATAGLVQARIAWFLLELDRPDDALKTLDAIVVPDGAGVPAIELRATIAAVRAAESSRRGDHDGAARERARELAALEELLRIDPDDIVTEDRVGLARGELARALVARARVAPGADAAAAAERAIEAAHRATQRAVERGGAANPRLPALLRNWADEALWAVERGEAQRAHPLLVELESQWRKLLAVRGDDPSHLEEFAPVLELRARALLAIGTLDPAERDAREAVRLRETLVGLLPGDPTARATLASARFTLANTLILRFRYQEAIDELRQVIALREELLALEPDSAPRQRELASALGKYVTAHTDWLRMRPELPLDDAARAAERGRDLAERLVASGQVTAADRQMLASTAFASGQIAEARGEPTAAALLYQRSAELLAAVIATEAEQVSQRVTQHLVLRALGRARLAGGEVHGAIEALRESVAVEEALRSRGVEYRDSSARLRDSFALLARALAANGEIAAAEAAAERIVELTPQQPVAHRLASEAWVEIARHAKGMADRERGFGRALDEARASRAVLEGGLGKGHESQDLMQRLSILQAQEQIAAVLRARGEHTALDAALREAIEMARSIARERGRDADRHRLVRLLDERIQLSIATGAEGEVEALRTERDALAQKR
ncbi:MAG: serine/threonine protein kinase [Planctomycetes bacterium]|nr:serine/threonine protein kinase [Planctomycetota bacterium]